MGGVARAGTPAVELAAKGVNAVYGETKVGKDLADFGISVEKLEKSNGELLNKPMLSQNDKLTRLGQAVRHGSQFAGSLAENAVTRTVPAMGVFNHLYGTKEAWQQAYRKKRDELEASRERQHPAEKESLAYREALLEALAQLLSPAPFSAVKRNTRANTDSPLTVITQDWGSGQVPFT